MLVIIAKDRIILNYKFTLYALLVAKLTSQTSLDFQPTKKTVIDLANVGVS